MNGISRVRGCALGMEGKDGEQAEGFNEGKKKKKKNQKQKRGGRREKELKRVSDRSGGNELERRLSFGKKEI